jgi:hypothetical protein
VKVTYHLSEQEMTGKSWGVGEWLGIAGVMIGLLGIGGSYYFYKVSEKEKEPILLVDPYRSVIVEAKSIKDFPLKVVGRDGKPVEKDITSMRFYFWNEGRESIKKADILKPVQLVLSSPNVEIIDYKTLAVSREEIVQPRIALNQYNGNTLDLSFDILEQDDGFSVQIIFMGSPDTEAEIKGVIEGAKGIRGMASENSYHFYKLMGTIIGLPLLLLLGSFIVTNSLGAWLGRRLSKVDFFRHNAMKLKQSKYLAFVPVVFIVATVAGTTLLIYTKEKQKIELKVVDSIVGTVPASIKPLSDVSK